MTLVAVKAEDFFLQPGLFQRSQIRLAVFEELIMLLSHKSIVLNKGMGLDLDLLLFIYSCLCTKGGVTRRARAAQSDLEQ